MDKLEYFITNENIYIKLGDETHLFNTCDACFSELKGAIESNNVTLVNDILNRNMFFIRKNVVMTDRYNNHFTIVDTGYVNGAYMVTMVSNGATIVKPFGDLEYYAIDIKNTIKAMAEF